MGTDDLVTLLVHLVQHPEDSDARRRAAMALDEHGRRAEAHGVLAPFVNFTGHEDGPLPCLCRSCLPTAGLTAEIQGMAFQRSFAIAGTRVLHFWLADELASDLREVRRSVGKALEERLKRKRRSHA